LALRSHCVCLRAHPRLRSPLWEVRRTPAARPCSSNRCIGAWSRRTVAGIHARRGRRLFLCCCAERSVRQVLPRLEQWTSPSTFLPDPILWVYDWYRSACSRERGTAPAPPP
jgi:hypothetical protein